LIPCRVWLSEQRSSKFVEIPWIEYVVWLGLRSVLFGVDRQGGVAVRLEEAERILLHRGQPVDLDLKSGWGLGVVVAG